MKVIKIVKTYRNGSTTFIKLVDSDYIDVIEEAAARECEDDSAGHIYGYEYTWEVVTDPLVIKDVVDRELNKAHETIESLKKRVIQLHTFLFSVNK